MEIIKIEWR